MTAITRSLLCLATLALVATAAHAQEKATPEDRAAIAKCLDKAMKTKAIAETCIGTVQGPCLEAPDGQSTFGMKMCADRETAVWNERLNKTYQNLMHGDLGQTDASPDGGKTKRAGADLFRDMQRAWIAFRDKKCEAAGLPMQGGSGAGVLIVDCYLQETARQAIWLSGMGDDEK
jgi:uncharacterized protein YecT (DUF1311 family)